MRLRLILAASIVLGMIAIPALAATVTANPSSAPVDSSVTVSGGGFVYASNSGCKLHLTSGPVPIDESTRIPSSNCSVDTAGTLTGSFDVPSIIPGSYVLWACYAPGGAPCDAGSAEVGSTPFTVESSTTTTTSTTTTSPTSTTTTTTSTTTTSSTPTTTTTQPGSSTSTTTTTAPGSSTSTTTTTAPGSPTTTSTTTTAPGSSTSTTTAAAGQGSTTSTTSAPAGETGSSQGLAEDPPQVLPLVQGTQVASRPTVTVAPEDVSAVSAEAFEASDPWSALDPALAATIASVVALAALLAVPRVRLTVRRTFRRTGWKHRPF